MSKKSNPTVIGGFVVGAILLIAAGVALFGGGELFTQRDVFVAYFEEQTKGLRVGSNVQLNGVRIGYVSEISLLIDEGNYETMTRVTLEVLPNTYIVLRDGVPLADGMSSSMDYEELIHDAGFRAQLEVESLITGQLLVRLDLRPETPAILRGVDSEYPEIPTMRSDIQEMLANLRAWLSNIQENVDFGALSRELTEALHAAGNLVNSEDVKASIAGINALINQEDTQQLSGSINMVLKDVSAAAREAAILFQSADEDVKSLTTELGPVIEKLGSALTTAERTLAAANLQLRGDSEQVYQLQSTLKEVEYAASALRDFFELLQRNPESLIRGKAN